MKSLSDQVVIEGLTLTESLVAALERKKENDGPVERSKQLTRAIWAPMTRIKWALSSYIDRAYQQNFVNTYIKMAYAKLYTKNTGYSARYDK